MEAVVKSVAVGNAKNVLGITILHRTLCRRPSMGVLQYWYSTNAEGKAWNKIGDSVTVVQRHPWKEACNIYDNRLL